MLKDALIGEMLKLIKNRDLHINEGQNWKEAWKKIHLILIWTLENKSALYNHAGAQVQDLKNSGLSFEQEKKKKKKKGRMSSCTTSSCTTQTSL